MIATVQKVFCRECQEYKDIPLALGELEAARLVALQLCFECHFWHRFEVVKDTEFSVRVGGKHYWIAPEEDLAPSDWRGMGGGRVIIRFFDGREVASTNLWYQGAIPQRWRDRLPDNAEFVKQVR